MTQMLGQTAPQQEPMHGGTQMMNAMGLPPWYGGMPGGIQPQYLQQPQLVPPNPISQIPQYQPPAQQLPPNPVLPPGPLYGRPVPTRAEEWLLVPPNPVFPIYLIPIPPLVPPHPITF
jgi:hypothetical protein